MSRLTMQADREGWRHEWTQWKDSGIFFVPNAVKDSGRSVCKSSKGGNEERRRKRERAGESNENTNAAQRRPAHDNGWVKYPGELMRKRGQVIAGPAGK